MKFYEAFGRQLKFGVYSDFGMNKDDLQDLLMFYSSKEKKLVTLLEYVERMADDQSHIYYATGESVTRIDKLPQTEMVAEQGYEILYLTEDIDEFALKMIASYNEKEFQSVSSADLNLSENDKESTATEEDQAIFAKMKGFLEGKVTDVRESKRLKTHPVFLAADGEITIEMEKVLQSMPDNQDVKADKVLEVNAQHDVFQSLKQADDETLELYTKLLYNQALLIEGLPLEDPVAFTQDVCKVMAN